MEDGKCDDEGDGEPKAEGSTCWGMRSDTQDGNFPRGADSRRDPTRKLTRMGLKMPPWEKRGGAPNCNG